MEITIIGVIVIILSIIAFFKNEDWLLYLTIFFSTFTAASVFTSGISLTLYKVPMLLWILKQIINFIKSKPKITIKKIKNLLKENKIFTALLIFICLIVISNIWLLISGLNYEYYDVTYSEDRVITFGNDNISQTVGILQVFAFLLILSFKKIDNGKIKKLLNVFLLSTVFAVLWGFIQFILYYLNVSYPAFLFNNNPGYVQHFNQIMHGIKRINSISTEPSVFGLNLIAAIPIILIPWMFNTQRKNKIFASIILAMIIICTILTTSSTAVVGLSVIVVALVIYLFVKSLKGNKEYKQKLLKLILYMAFCLVFLLLCLIPSQIANNTHIESINTQVVQKETVSKKMNIIDAIKEMTISKLSSGSGQERMEREGLGFEVYSVSPIFGVGYGSFRTFTLFTNVLVNMGILGLVALIYIIYVVLKTIIINRKKDEKYYLIFMLSIIGMVSAFAVSIPDLIYIYLWMILVLGFKYFTNPKENLERNKENLIVGIDARGLNNKKTGISTYIEEIVKRINLDVDSNTKYILYSNRDINIDANLNKNIILKNYKKPAGTLWVYFCLPKILKEDNVDIFWGTQHCLPMRNQYTKNIKFLLTVHDLAIHKLKTVGSWKNTIIQRLFVKKSCKSADRIIAVSKATKNDILEIFKIDESKIKIIYEGTNFTQDYNLTREQEIKIEEKFNIKNKNYIFFLSTIEPRKNLNTAIKAFERYKEEKNDDLKFIISGGVGWKCQDTLKMIENSKYQADIIRTGYITKEEKEYFFKNCKAFMYPSLYEGFGLPILEAMQKGVLVITSNISSIPEVGGNVPLYLNNVYDENELKELIKKALTLNEDIKKEVIKLGYEQVKKFTWEKCTKEILEIIMQLSKKI